MDQSHEVIHFLFWVILSIPLSSYQAGNIAYRGMAWQAAEKELNDTGPAPVAPQKVIDYTFSKAYFNTCTSIPMQDNPWWRVDLGAIYNVTHLIILPYRYCCVEQLDGAEVYMGLQPDTNSFKCGVITAVEGSKKYILSCAVQQVRFVHIVLPGLNKILTLCEVMVYGHVYENVAVRGVALQSSFLTTPPRRINDGSQRSCSVLQTKPNQWHMVDLMAPYTVMVVQISFRRTCCFNYKVLVDSTSCSFVSTSIKFNYIMTWVCGGTVGRAVTVMHEDVPMILCELEVFTNQEYIINKFPQQPLRDNYCKGDSCSRGIILVERPMSWLDSQAYCRDRYSDLVSIKDVQDMNLLGENAYLALQDIWIGLYEDVSITWVWSLSDESYYGDGEAEFRHWAAGEPGSEISIQHCTGMIDTGEWRDLDCESLHDFICYDGSADPLQSKILVNTSMRWSEAQHYCRHRHMDLVSVRNLAENQEIQSLVPAGKVVWIGLFGDSWKWVDESKSAFRFWRGEQPTTTGQGLNCVHFNGTTWGAKSCDTKSMFLCSYYKRKSLLKITTNYDISDPLTREQVIKQLQAALKKKGIPRADARIRWMQSAGRGSQNGVQKTEEKLRCVKDEL